MLLMFALTITLNIIIMKIYTVKAIIEGTVENLWNGYTKSEARRVSDNYNKTIPFGGKTSWIWDNDRDGITI